MKLSEIVNRNNFFISTDPDGNMPVLTHIKPAKKHWIKYINNKPVDWNLPEGEERIWDYSENKMYGIHDKVPSLDPSKKGKFLPVIKKK